MEPLQIVLTSLEEHTPIKVKELVEKTGFSETTVRKYLKELLDEGRIIHNKAKAHYTLLGRLKLKSVKSSTKDQKKRLNINPQYKIKQMQKKVEGLNGELVYLRKDRKWTLALPGKDLEVIAPQDLQSRIFTL